MTISLCAILYQFESTGARTLGLAIIIIQQIGKPNRGRKPWPSAGPCNLFREIAITYQR